MSGMQSPVGHFGKLWIERDDKLVKIWLRNKKGPLTMHEELLCLHSPYFREKLQEGRKALTEGDECPICKEEMDPNKTSLTFCRSGCGQNFHKHCMNEWKEAECSLVEGDNVHHCPLCRHVWTGAGQVEWEFPNLDDLNAFKRYFKYLYFGTVQLLVDSDDPDDQVFSYLFEAYSLGVEVKDRGFQNTVLETMADVIMGI